MTIAATDADIQEIEARHGRATEGIWVCQKPNFGYDESGVAVIAHLSNADGTIVDTPTNGMVAWATMQPTKFDAGDTERAQANGEFLASAHQDIPSLLLRIKQDGERIKGLEAALKFPYDATFNAIAAAVTRNDHSLGISVQRFVQAFRAWTDAANAHTLAPKDTVNDN